MTIFFTEEENKWINKDAFNWTIKEGCPDNVRKTLQLKLEKLKNEHNSFSNGSRHKT
jgi:hypothetical protein